MGGVKIHTATERKTPTGYMVICSCGWSFFVPRQNAWARAAKLKSAASKHLGETEKASQP